MMKTAVLFGVISLIFSETSLASDCPDLGQNAVFTISGNLPRSTKATSVVFSRQDLTALPSKRAIMDRPWAKTPAVIQGPLLSDVIAASGMLGTRVRIRAKNNYATEISLEHANGFSAIVNMSMDGENLTLRNGGPLFLLHPVVSKTSNPEETYESYSIWQVCRIEVD